MNKRAGYVYMATTCSMVVLTPGRFAIGLILVIQMCLLMFLGTLFRSLIRVLKMEKMSSTLMLSFMVFFIKASNIFLLCFYYIKKAHSCEQAFFVVCGIVADNLKFKVVCFDKFCLKIYTEQSLILGHDVSARSVIADGVFERFAAV